MKRLIFLASLLVGLALAFAPIEAPRVSAQTFPGQTSPGYIPIGQGAAPIKWLPVTGCTLTSPGALSCPIGIGTTTITSPTANQILYDNAGTLGEVTKCNNGAYVTNGSGVPSCGSVPVAALPPGVDTNTLNAVTSSPSLSSSNCGQMTTLGGSASYTVTVGAASGFSGTCVLPFCNIDSGRAKAMAVNGITFPNGGFLWPLQCTVIKNENNVWTVAYDPGLWRFPADQTFFVDPVNGSNSNDCLASGTGACLTIQAAVNYACTYIDAMGHKPIIQLADDTTHYTVQVNLCTVKGVVNTGFTSVPTLRGNVASLGNVRISVTSGNGVAAVDLPHAWRVEGIDFRETTSGAAILTDVYSRIYIGTNTFNVGSCCIVFQALNGGFIEWVSNFTIAGNANVVMYANNQGKFVAQPITVTISGTPAWAFAFAYHFDGATSFIPSVTFSGSATGNRCNIATGGGIDTGGAGSSYLPGNVACSGTAIVNPGWYN